ncbi:MAG: DUF1877 family protein [Sphingopyxis sp.]|uniref:DUF1877 family protein n=1 Tax=Sphingopyxis sp. TaxID=1908224 RepID=UPI001A4C98B2|nr:DUF1877 family protein [Sphingopyxis sp.]MBL9069270.1 DUF1877 family protein [Sphingopyxis sp.]
MGIGYSLIRTSLDNIEALRGRPEAVAEFVYQDPGAYVAPKPGFLSRLFDSPAKVAKVPVPERSDGDETGLDKSWHIVHYLLSGDSGRGAGPLAIIGDDLHPLADLDLGLGKPNVISAEAAKAFTVAAAAMSEVDFLVRYVPDEMPLDELYMGEVVARGDVDDIREYALENFHVLRNFVRQAAENNEAIITYYS